MRIGMGNENLREMTGESAWNDRGICGEICVSVKKITAIDHLKQPCVCHASRNSALNVVLYFKLASSQSEAFIKLDNLCHNKNSLKDLSGVRLVLNSTLIYCYVTKLAEEKTRFGFNTYQVTHHSPAW